MEYTVTWTIEIFAESFGEAARKALEIQRDPESTATYFQIVDEDGAERNVWADQTEPYPEPPQDEEESADAPDGPAVFVLVVMEDGAIRAVEPFETRKLAVAAERRWLHTFGIQDEHEREHRANYGTGMAIWECELRT